MDVSPNSGEWTRWRPWRSVLVPTIVTVVTLVIGVPLFLRMPPWCDVTLYDLAARNILRGGVHYRDVFDTNLPGFVWLLAGVRTVFGWSTEALRAVDLCVIATAAFGLAKWVRKLGGSSASVAWFVAAIALFYPFTSEFSHVQRDPWMLLPAVVAAYLCMTQVSHPQRTPSTRFGWAMVEGLLWGTAIWIKPHVIVPAFAVWLVGVVIQLRGGRFLLSDLFGLLTGGLAIGGAGVAWIIGTGAWPAFWDVFTNWNPEYTKETLAELPDRYLFTVLYFPPWSLLHGIAIPLACWHIVDRRAPPTTARVLFAIFYLAWMGQALVLQRAVDYVHLPETLLAMALLAGQRWAIGLPFLVWFVATGVALNCAESTVRGKDPKWPYLPLETHPVFDSAVLRRWPDCWNPADPDELRDALGQFKNAHPSATWHDLRAVATFLKTVDPPLRDRELTAFHDSTHPLYLMLDLEPSTRYLHFGTAFTFRKHAAQIAGEVRASPQRYVVSDLSRMTHHRRDVLLPDVKGTMNGLPAWLPLSQRDQFPWNQPVVFRSNRYLVHRVDKPIGVVDVPLWQDLDKLGPGES